MESKSTIFRPGARVTNKRKLRPCKLNGNQVVPIWAKGTITHSGPVQVFVQFDHMDSEIRVLVSDLALLSLDERYALEVEFYQEIATHAS